MPARLSWISCLVVLAMSFVTPLSIHGQTCPPNTIYCPTTTKLYVSTPAYAGGDINVQATVIPASHPPGGTVSFYAGSKLICNTEWISNPQSCDAPADLQPGNYSFTASYSGFGWDGIDYESSTSSPVEVAVGVPSTATVLSNLQAVQEWKLCEGECVINGTNTGPPDNNGYIYYGISSPSLSGASVEQMDDSTNYPYFDVLYSLDEANELDQGLTLGCSTAPCPFNHFIDDLWFYVPQSSLGSIEALEFDPDYSDPSQHTYKMSMECTSPYDNPANHWQYWNSATNKWVDTLQDCSSVWNNHDQWQHLTIQTAVNSSNNTYTYQAVSIGVQGSPQQSVTWQSMSTPISAGSTPQGWPMNVWVQQEIDNTSAGGTSIVYYDDYTLTVWNQ